MTNSYQYSIKVNEALERYGAKTCGPLERRVERLKRFTEMKNNAYAAGLRVDDARMIANQEREYRVKNRVREIYNQEFLAAIDKRDGVRRNLLQEFNEAIEEADTPSRYNLRPRTENYGMNLLATAIENGFVNARRG